MILVIDNFDSFTYNLVQGLEALGGHTEVRRNDAIRVEEIEPMQPEAIVISPGPCTPREAGISVEIVRRMSGRIPILGVCLGYQCIGQAFGGKIVTRRPVMHGKTSDVLHDGRYLFEGLPSPLSVARYHSLVIDPATLPSELVPTARTEDGVLMAVTHRRHPTFGVQFHPESYLTPRGPDILMNFLRCIPCPSASPID